MGSQAAPRRLRRSRAAAIAVLVSGLLLASRFDAAETDLKVDYDKTFSFAGLRTWTWHPDGAGDVRLAVSSQDDPKRVAARVDPVIVPAVEREMTARGFARAATTPDVYVHYYVLATVNQSAQQLGQFLPPTGEWGLPPLHASTTALSIYPVGTLIIDISSPEEKAVVWRGAAQRKINLERPDDERRKVLEQAIRNLLKRFPPKK
jgi:uncharacterized protein DUF4136